MWLYCSAALDVKSTCVRHFIHLYDLLRYQKCVFGKKTAVMVCFVLHLSQIVLISPIPAPWSRKIMKSVEKVYVHLVKQFVVCWKTSIYCTFYTCLKSHLRRFPNFRLHFAFRAQPKTQHAMTSIYIALSCCFLFWCGVV